MNNLARLLLIFVFAKICFLIVFCISIWKDNQPRSKFKENYRIDLKQNGYLVKKCHNGEIVFVPKDSLELFFLNDNL